MAQLESMFGSPPEMVDLQIDQENQQWANRPGDAYQRMASAGSLAAQRGGTALGDAFGIVDPRKAIALKVQDALKEIKDSGVDLNQDPVEFYTAMSKAFASRGLMEQATQASMKAMELKDKSAERADKESSRANKLAIENLELAEAQAKLKIAMAKTQGKPEASALMEIIKDNYKDASVESVTAAYDVLNNGGSLMDAQKKLQTKRENEKMIGTTPDGLPVFRKEGEATYVVQNGQKIPYEGAVKPTGGITNDLRQDTAENQAKLVRYTKGTERFQKQQEAAARIKPYVEELTSLSKSALNTGSWSGWQTEIKRALNTVGITKDASVGNDDLFDSYIMQFVLPRMADLGGSDSNEELKALRNMTGDRKWTPETMQKAFGIIRREVAKFEAKERAYEKHIADGGSELDFDFATGKAIVRGKRGQPAKEPIEQPTPKENNSVQQSEYTPSSSEMDRYKAQLTRMGAKVPDDETIKQRLIQAKRK